MVKSENFVKVIIFTVNSPCKRGDANPTEKRRHNSGGILEQIFIVHPGITEPKRGGY